MSGRGIVVCLVEAALTELGSGESFLIDEEFCTTCWLGDTKGLNGQQESGRNSNFEDPTRAKKRATNYFKYRFLASTEFFSRIPIWDRLSGGSFTRHDANRSDGSARAACWTLGGPARIVGASFPAPGTWPA